MILKLIEQLYLADSYSFNVVYKQGDTAFAAKLELTPDNISFTVMADEHGDRKCELYEAHLEELICEVNNDVFILRKLEMVESSHRVITDDYKIWFSESTYSVGSLIYCSKVHSEKLSFSDVKLFSKSLGPWLGLTFKQEKIFTEYEVRSKEIFDDPYEFLYALDEHESVGVKYNIKIGGSDDYFKSGLSFTPTFDCALNQASPEKAIDTYNKAFNFLSFVLGYNPPVERVEMICDGCITASLYMPTKAPSHGARSRFVMLPLGTNVRPQFEYSGLPPIPSEFFVSYFKEHSEFPSLIDKYITYRGMANVEDRFLGFFRLLEKLCHQKKSYLDGETLKKVILNNRQFLRGAGIGKEQVRSFEKALMRANASKYNTEKCVSDFYDSLPLEIRASLRFGRDAIKEVCLLRNDITHANHYSLSEGKVYEYTSLVEHLLTFSILERLGLNLNDFAKIATRVE